MLTAAPCRHDDPQAVANRHEEAALRRAEQGDQPQIGQISATPDKTASKRSSRKRKTTAKAGKPVGASRLTRYAVKSTTTGPRIEPFLKPEAPTAPVAAPAAAKSATAGSHTKADFDAAVLAEVSRQGPASSTVIHTAVGGKLDEVRASLKRLVDAGQVTRSGERRFTRYTLK